MNGNDDIRAHEPAPGTQAHADMLKSATQRLSFRRSRDALPTRIDTARLVLRAPMRGDVPALQKLADNPNVADKLARLPSPYTRADAIAFVEIFAQRADERPFAITTRQGEFLGIVGFTFAMGSHAELGYWLGEPYWGQGFMSEAVKALLEAAFATGLFPAIEARALQSNAASIHVLQKAGFATIGQDTEAPGPGRGRPLFKFRLERPR